ncbi:hypothetical protein [Flavobacterium frigoris]|uniref:Uncharacterized protein n=1 Tax=Flavobacterium frigoris TaxID=229204 RepID=A0A1H9LY60_FLAFI|nr:hypothetical protein [Flavobacterium frigoris]SER16376.1 hypothetical protein SAMN05444355_107183 [Flavobacterium frigoris]
MNLELNKSSANKFSFIEIDEDQLYISNLLDSHLYEFPIENFTELVLVDIDSKEILKRFATVGEVDFGKLKVQSLNVRGVSPNLLANIKFPSTLEILGIQGGDYMSNVLSDNPITKHMWMTYYDATLC